jgi:hemoglobin
MLSNALKPARSGAASRAARALGSAITRGSALPDAFSATASPFSSASAAPPASAAAAAGNPDSLLSRLGGPAALDATLNTFYGGMIKDPFLANFFKGVDMARLKAHQAKFMTMAFTGIPEGTDVAGYMTRGHARLVREQGLDETHFDAVAGHLVRSLKELNVPKPLIDEVVGVVGPLRGVFEKNAADHRARVAAAKPE